MKNFYKDDFNVAFFGIGNMGGPMAINLAKKGVTVRAFDLVPTLIENIKKEGVEGCLDIDTTLENADVIISMLPNDNAVLDLYLGNKEKGTSGILDKCAKEKSCLFIDSSTISPKTVEVVSSRARELNHFLVDAPVSGGVGGAKAGILTFICGGENREIEMITPILQKMGQNIFHAGPIGSGQKAKLLNNTMLAISMIGTSELLNMGHSLGLDVNVLSEIMKKSSGNSWVLEKYNPYPNVMPTVPSSNDYAGGFGSKLMLKDLNLAINMMSEFNETLDNPMGQLAKSLYETHTQKEDLRGNLDFSSIIKTLRKE